MNSYLGEILFPDLSTLIFVFVAGASAFLSPCAYPMLPGYISYYMGKNFSLIKALYSGFFLTMGLITTFSIIGLIASILGNIINSYIPILELVAGIAMILLGISILFEINIFFTPTLKTPKRNGLLGIYFYGIIYGLATLGCSAPIFFATLFWAVVQSGPLTGLITFIVYSFGMGVPLILTTILLSIFKKKSLNKLKNMTPKIQKLSGIILIVIGIYLMYFYYMFL